jgi:hypothetical protein
MKCCFDLIVALSLFTPEGVQTFDHGDHEPALLKSVRSPLPDNMW